MKNLKLVLLFFALLAFGTTEYVEAQVYRTPQERRMVRRKVRRHNRRVARRTLRRLPANTRGIACRKVTYYPVRGMYYVQRKDIYVRAFPPRGFRLRVLPTTTVRITVRGVPYHYADGVFYQQVKEEYEVAAPPVGAVLQELPEDAEEIDFDGVSMYELNQAVYKEVENGYEIIDVLAEETDNWFGVIKKQKTPSRNIGGVFHL